jgi:hypothetical protein
VVAICCAGHEGVASRPAAVVRRGVTRYFKNFEVVLSARILPPVWQVAQ